MCRAGMNQPKGAKEQNAASIVEEVGGRRRVGGDNCRRRTKGAVAAGGIRSREVHPDEWGT